MTSHTLVRETSSLVYDADNIVQAHTRGFGV